MRNKPWASPISAVGARKDACRQLNLRVINGWVAPMQKNEAMKNEAFVTMDLMDRIQIVRDRAMNEGYIATAKALDNLLKNGVLFELPKGKKDSPNEQTLS